MSSSDSKLLEVSLPILPPGTYYVIWSVVDSGPGHRTTGDYIFIVK
ncbi:MAG: copper resistance protein CopC [Thermodesulfobacteriota bacterium]